MLRLFIVALICLMAHSAIASAQSERNEVRRGNREFRKGNFLDSEIAYRSALDLNPASFKANYNLAASLYKQEKFEEAAKILNELSGQNVSDRLRANVYHNLGNSLLNQKKVAESIEAYKNALRLTPDDMDTKYNLSEAIRRLQEQPQDQSNQGDQGSDDQNKEQDKEQEQNDNQNQQQDDPKGKNEDEKKQQQQLTPEEARRMLDAMRTNEREIQERLLEQQEQAKKMPREKNW